MGGVFKAVGAPLGAVGGTMLGGPLGGWLGANLMGYAANRPPVGIPAPSPLQLTDNGQAFVQKQPSQQGLPSPVAYRDLTHKPSVIDILNTRSLI